MKDKILDLVAYYGRRLTIEEMAAHLPYSIQDIRKEMMTQSTEGMDEETYHAVARAFEVVGANRLAVCQGIHWDFFGWDNDHGLKGWDRGSYAEEKASRCLTPAQVISASTTPDPLTTLRTAKATLDDARAEYRKALDALREALGEGFVVSEAGETPEPDMTDPANWRAGDVVECLFRMYVGYNYEDTYRIGKRRYDGKRIGVINDDGCEQFRMCSNFRFHHRPNT